MDHFHTYILYSKSLDKFYIGSTRLDSTIRLERHLEKYYGDLKFTAKAKDWILFYKIECASFSQAVKIENHIKRMKSKTYIRNLTKYPEISEKLKAQY